jgi:hypothetical protein
MENALERLENITREETLMTGAEILKAVHCVDKKVGCTLQGVVDMLQGVDDRGGYRREMRPCVVGRRGPNLRPWQRAKARQFENSAVVRMC